jgi:uncharacterized membrane protein
MTGETDLARIARIGDSVFAVTITLLAYRVHPPSHDTLVSANVSLWMPFITDLAAVGLSFFVASVFWVSHWRVFRRMRQSDMRFVALNLAFLGTLILLPISTSLVSSDFTRLGMLAYSSNLFLASMAGFFLRMHARRLDPHAFGPGRILLTPAMSMTIFGAAALVSLWSPVTAVALWIGALATPWIDSRWGIGRTA